MRHERRHAAEANMFPRRHSSPCNLLRLCLLRLRTVREKALRRMRQFLQCVCEHRGPGWCAYSRRVICVYCNWAVRQERGSSGSGDCKIPQTKASLIVVAKPVWVESLQKGDDWAFQSSQKHYCSADLTLQKFIKRTWQILRRKLKSPFHFDCSAV